MKLKTSLMAAALAVAFIAASSAHAMDYSYRVFGKQIVIDATGEIEMDEASRLFNWINAQRWGHRRAYTIVFDSPGGDMYGGVQMAAIVARVGLNTGVAHGGECASACVMAWAAGVHKSTATDARIGVHMARDGDQIASDATLFYARFVKQTGAPASVVAGLVSTPPQEVYWLSLAELRAWNTTIVDEADTPLNRAYRPQVAQPTPAPTPLGPLWLILILWGLSYAFGGKRRETARNTAILAERATWTEAQKAAYQAERAKRAERLAGRRRFVLVLLAVLVGAGWALGALFGKG